MVFLSSGCTCTCTALCRLLAASILRVITRQTDSALAKPGSHLLRLSPRLDPLAWRDRRRLSGEALRRREEAKLGCLAQSLE
ncbi:hypothetical protein ACQKWADRAFT_300045 [Trichoderma austrokoningii]